MIVRSLLLSAVLLPLIVPAQEKGAQQGTPFSKTLKNAKVLADFHVVVDGIVDATGKPVLFIEEGLGHKVVRLDADLRPTEELALTQLTFDALKWEGVSPIIRDGQLFVLFVSSTKKSCDYGIGAVNTSGALSITGFHKVATFDASYEFDPAVTASKKVLPDLILYDNGIAYDQRERVVASADGQHYLLNYYTRDQKGLKKFWYACLDHEFALQWSGMKELPFEDLRSDVRQIELGNDGRIFLLTYVFKCADIGQAADKQCHELHLTVLRDQGARLKDMLVEKDFVASARMRPKADGRLLLALRYGSLTGQAGMLLSIDTAITKLKPTPLVDQRVPAIRKTKLTTFGLPPTDTGKKTAGASRATAKVPDEIVDVVPAWENGSVLIEAFHDPEMQVTVGEAIAMRHLNGAIRVTYLDARDSVRWQRTVERAFMTTAGEPSEGVAWVLREDGVQLLYDQTPGGINAINNVYMNDEEDGGKKKKDQLTSIEPCELKTAFVPRDGSEAKERSLLRCEKPWMVCPQSLVTDPAGHKAWLKAYDRGSQHMYVEADL